MKYALSIFLGLIFTTLVGVFIAHAQDYTPLAPLPGTFTGATGSETTNISTYLGGMLKLLIALGAGVSILVAIIGGTQYVAAGIAPSAKQDAKERIFNAFIGLTLVLTSYLILNSINPGLVNFNFSLPPIGTSPMTTTTAPTAVTGEPWPDDAAERTQLSSKNIMVAGTRTSSSCKTIGEQGCTSVYQLGSGAISGLLSLKDSCLSCAIVVTGGTEYWSHSVNTAHRPGNSVVDIDDGSSALNQKIRSGTSLGVQSSCSSLGPAYRLTGSGAGIYVDEGNHWHVCY